MPSVFSIFSINFLNFSPLNLSVAGTSYLRELLTHVLSGWKLILTFLNFDRICEHSSGFDFFDRRLTFLFALIQLLLRSCFVHQISDRLKLDRVINSKNIFRRHFIRVGFFGGQDAYIFWQDRARVH